MMAMPDDEPSVGPEASIAAVAGGMQQRLAIAGFGVTLPPANL